MEYFKQITIWLASGTETAAAVIIALAAIEATVRSLWLFVPGVQSKMGPRAPQGAKDEVRLRLGRWLAVALDSNSPPTCCARRWPRPGTK